MGHSIHIGGLQLSKAPGLIGKSPILLVHDGITLVMNQIIMAVHAFFFIARTRIDHRPVGQHGTSVARHVQQIPMAFLALGIIKRVVGSLSVFITIVFFYHEMLNHVLGTMIGFGKEEVEGLVRRRQMTVHTIGHESLGIIDMGGGSPGHHCRFDLMAQGTKIRSGGTNHGVVGHAEQRKSDDNTQYNQRHPYDVFFHDVASASGWSLYLVNQLRHKGFLTDFYSFYLSSIILKRSRNKIVKVVTPKRLLISGLMDRTIKIEMFN